jgi:hypothetical protein
MTPPLNRDQEQPTSKKAWATPTAGMSRRSDLPVWESFPLADRHMLIGVIVQMARRQLPSRLAPDREPTRR